MEQTEIREGIIDILKDVSMEDDLSALKADQPLREQLSLDSMDLLDIVMQLKKFHKIEVKPEEFGELATLDSCVAFVGKKLN